MSTPPTPQFQVAVGDSKATFLGPSWATEEARRSLHRINRTATTGEAIAQGVAESVMVLHSIRRILIWIAVIVPSVLAVLLIVLLVANSGADLGSVY
jgi:hypothetical protein